MMKCRCAKTLILLSVSIFTVVIILFAIGPQLGSLDVDGDGIPEVPIVISYHSVATSHSTLHHKPRTILVTVASSLSPPGAPGSLGSARKLASNPIDFAPH